MVALALGLIPRLNKTVGIWCAIMGVNGILIVGSKLAFMGWGVGIKSLDFTGFSGHTALSATVWPAIFWTVAKKWLPGLRSAEMVAVLAGWTLAALIGLSRLALDSHSISEVAAGYILGLLLSATFFWLVRESQLQRVNLWPIGAIIGLVLMLGHFGFQAPTQSLQQHIAKQIAGLDRPFKRRDLRNSTRPERLEMKCQSRSDTADC